MANYVTNVFRANTDNSQDLITIEAFLKENFEGDVNLYANIIEAEFFSRWVFPEEEMGRLVESLEAKDKVDIKILTYEFEDGYVTLRVFSQGKWDIKA